MSNWDGSSRRQELPRDWEHRRRRVLARDNRRCTHRDQYGRRCDEPATDVDHIVPGGNHAESNLRSLCSWHHGKKSGNEGGAARAANWRRNDKKFRRTESHPGLL